MRVPALAIGLLVVPLSAFAVPEAFQSQMDSWIGRPEQDLFAHFRSPDVIYDGDDYRLIVISRLGSVSAPGQQPPQMTMLIFGEADETTMNESCRVTFTIRGTDRVVESWGAQGDRCVAEKLGPRPQVPAQATLPHRAPPDAPVDEAAMDSVTKLVCAVFVFLLIGLGRWTRSEGGPFAVLLKPLVENIGPHCQVIAYNLYGAAAGVVLLYVSLFDMPNERAILIQWWTAVIIFLTALGGALAFAKLGQSWSANEQLFERMRQVVSLILASVSAYSMSVAGSSLFRVLFRYPDSDRGTVFMYSVLAAVSILVAGIATDRKWPLVAPMVLFGVLDFFWTTIGRQQQNFQVAFALFLFAFLCRGVPNRRTSDPDLPSWVHS